MNESKLLAGRWALGPLIGVGASGRVFRADDLQTGTPAAVKLLHPHVISSPVLRARYQREARLAASVEHPGLCRFYDAGENEEAAWIAMELLEGTTFADWLDANPPDHEERLTRGLRVLRAVLEPLAALHDIGVIHRDIKPDNIFLVSSNAFEGAVKLLDLGIARDEDAVSATQTGITFGTPLYMSPEQAMDPRACTAAADVWSFGAMLYEVLTGRPPFEGPSPAAIWIAALQEPHAPLPETVPAWARAFEPLLDRCLAKSPGQRFANARATAEAWDALDLALPQLEERMTVPIRLPPRSMSRPGADVVRAGTQVSSPPPPVVEPRAPATHTLAQVSAPNTAPLPAIEEPAPSARWPKVAVIGALVAAVAGLAYRASLTSPVPAGPPEVVDPQPTAADGVPDAPSRAGPIVAPTMSAAPSLVTAPLSAPPSPSAVVSRPTPRTRLPTVAGSTPVEPVAAPTAPPSAPAEPTTEAPPTSPPTAAPTAAPPPSVPPPVVRSAPPAAPTSPPRPPPTTAPTRPPFVTF